MIANDPTIADHPGRPRVTLVRVIDSEWTKFRTVRSNVVATAALVVVVVGIGLLFSAAGGPGGAAQAPPGSRGAGGFDTSRVGVALGGFTPGQIIVGVLGVLCASSEYSTGMIRTTLAAVGRRMPVFAAKVAVVTVVFAVATVVAAVAAFVLGGAVYRGSDAALSLTDPAVLRAVLGTALYATGFGLIGLALGFLVRSTAGAIGILVAGLLVVPTLVGLLPSSVNDSFGRFLPSNAGRAFTSLQATGSSLTPGAGAVVYALWVLTLLGLAGWSFIRRDA